MFRSAVAAQIEIPPIILFLQSAFFHAREKHVDTLFPLATADDLAHAGNQKVHRGNGFIVVVEPHIEGFDLFRVVHKEHGHSIDVLREIPLMLGLEIAPPLHGIFEGLTALFEQVDRLGVSDFFVVALGKFRQAFQ